MPTVVGADLTFSLERHGEATVHGRLTGQANQLRLDVDDPAVFAGAGDAPTVRAAAAELARRGIVVSVMHDGEHLISLGRVRVRWWQRRITGSPHIRLGSLKGAWTAARARASRGEPVLPGAGVLPAPTLWPLAPTFQRMPKPPVSTTHTAHDATEDTAKLVLVREAYYPGEGQLVFPLREGMRIGSAPECEVRLKDLEPLHARMTHDEADEWVIQAVGGRVRVAGTSVVEQLLRTGTRVEIGPHVLIYSRAENADHGRPHGGRVGGEVGRQETQASRSAPPPRPGQTSQ